MVAVQRNVHARMRYDVAFNLWIIKLRQRYPANESRFIRQLIPTKRDVSEEN